ncbi:hypothetical protein FNV43_RR18687 [Rhamnella rubrinervis]|uniref:C-JID domain-containing protein n=1 Tax=Rhamnella rubrinervis TaxID=2594499 RepID=A0A8K0E5K0_9ROSA|nr:hypothetical protein FNV43_RR18687 [Rhamnella rubrinervis]
MVREGSRNPGTKAIKAIVFDPYETETDPSWNSRAFSGMSNLELLSICSDVHLSQGLDYLPEKLRFFKWRRYPLKSLPPNFYPSELVELNMCHSQLLQLWRGEKIFENLKFIKLGHSRNLIETPDFTGVPNLEGLDLEGCTNLVEVHPSIGILKRLRPVNLKDCFSLRSFPNTISTESLDLSGCSKLDKFPDAEGNMLCLSQLYLDEVATENLPNSTIEHLVGRPSFASLASSTPNIIRLSLRNCELPEGALPSDIGRLTSLEEVSHLSGRFDIIIPGTRIPEWFRHQNMGPSVRIHLPRNWSNNNWIGFVFCVVFGIHDENVDAEHDSQFQESESSHEITCQLYTNEGSVSTGFGFKISSVTCFKSDHVWVRYVSNRSFKEPMVKWSSINSAEASFGTESQYLEVKKCGFRAVYKKDVEELRNRELQFIFPPTQDLGLHFFSFDT